jgi:hypothetical protein
MYPSLTTVSINKHLVCRHTVYITSILKTNFMANVIKTTRLTFLGSSKKNIKYGIVIMILTNKRKVHTVFKRDRKYISINKHLVCRHTVYITSINFNIHEPIHINVLITCNYIAT